ncbi:MAG: YihY/virulence factor BrkB family protein [Dehalococcoidia bacterium]
MRRLLILTVRSVQEFGADRCSHMAAAISYYGLFSLFPLLIFMVSIFGIFLQSSSLQEDLIDEVLEFLPLTSDEGRNEVKDAIGAIAGISIPLSIVGLLGLAWSASAMFGAIRTSLNIAWDVETPRHFVKQKLLDLGMVAGVGVFFLLSIGATGLLRTTQEASSDILGPLSSDTAFFWRAVGYLMPAIFSFGAFIVVYRFVPNAPIKLGDVWPGALVAALFFEVIKNGFSFYIANFGRYDVVYGSLGAVVAFLFWMYLSAVALLLGAEVASEYPRAMTGKYDHLWGQGWLLGGGRAKLAQLWQKVRIRLARKERVRR